MTFDPNGGTGTMANQVANVPTALTANTFTRVGFTFAGWGTASGGPVVYADGATYSLQRMSRCMPSGRRCRCTR